MKMASTLLLNLSPKTRAVPTSSTELGSEKQTALYNIGDVLIAK